MTAPQEVLVTLDDLGGEPDRCDFCIDIATEVTGRSQRCDKHAQQARLAVEFGSFVLTRSELAGIPPTRFVIDGVKPVGAVVSVGGYGSFKSFTELGMALCVATGRRWLGRTVEQGRVLFVVGEGANGLHRRVTAWEKGYNDGKSVGDDVFRVVRRPGSLTDPATWEALTAYAVEHGFRYVVLDTFSSLAPDADETKNAAVVISRMTDLAVAVDGCVTLVHHTGWGDKTRARGGSQLESNADGVLVYSLMADGALPFSVTFKKMKESAGGGQMYLRGKVWDLCDGGDSTLVIERVDAAEVGVPVSDRIVTTLRSYADVGATAAQLKRDVESSGSAFYDPLNRLRRDGLVLAEVDGEDKPKRSGRWWLAEFAPKDAR